MEEPDYDDLIEDYMEDFEEPPPAAAPVYDDDFLEEMEAAAASGETAATNNRTREDTPDMPSPASPISRDLPYRLRAASEASEDAIAQDSTSPAAQVRSELASRRSSREVTAPDIFSFERYKGNVSWRHEATASPSTMRAREWKSKHDQTINEMMASNANTKAKAGETQLLHYLNKANRQSMQYISRYDKHLKLLPSEGHKNLPMTLGDGTRVFVKVLKETKASTKTNNKHSCSLGISITDLLRRVQAVQRKKEHDRMKDLSHELKQQRKKLAAKMEGDGTDTDNDASDDEETDQNELTLVEPIDDRLWVDKHAPSTFANLLSDERTNREVLRALREWDPYVFKRDAPPRPQFYAQQQMGKENEDIKKNPKDKRPDERNRVILLSGSPGVGKTTLAHIVARHCGYRPMEVNGSDERSAQALTERVVRAMETATLDMHAMGAKGNDWKGRPNCIILDEIDGADAKQALQALVELIRQEMPSKDASGKQRNKAYLKRPIIFICNNLYAPALRPLLPYARSFQVDPPAAPRLVARLRAVLASESLSLWGGATLLHDLVACSGGDIRSCLYTLQFAAAQVHRQQKLSNTNKDISKSLQSALKGDGMKDDRTDVAGTTMTVFRKIKNKGKDDRLWGTRQASDPRTSVERVLDAVESFGEHSKILDCLYLNVLNVSYIDPTFDRCSAALQWLSGADNKSIQHFYVPCAAAALHLLCRVEQKPELTYSTRELMDNRYRLEANLGLTHKFAEGLSPQYRGSRTSDAIVKEMVPYALWMLSAGDGSSALSRPASSVEILKQRELESFVKHSDTLRTLGLTYVASTHDDNQNNNDGETHMILDPPIHRLVYYQYLNRRPEAGRKPIPSPMKELLARRAALQGIRDSPSATQTNKGKPLGNPAAKDEGSPPPQSNPTSSEDAKKPVVEKPMPSHQIAIITPPLEGANNKRSTVVSTKENAENARPLKRQKPSPVSAQNFLGVGAKRARDQRSARRAKNVGFVRTRTGQEKQSNTGSGVPFKQVIRLKFVKGFTQAVRNPCRMEDLI